MPIASRERQDAVKLHRRERSSPARPPNRPLSGWMPASVPSPRKSPPENQSGELDEPGDIWGGGFCQGGFGGAARGEGTREADE